MSNFLLRKRDCDIRSKWHICGHCATVGECRRPMFSCRNFLCCPFPIHLTFVVGHFPSYPVACLWTVFAPFGKHCLQRSSHRLFYVLLLTVTGKLPPPSWKPVVAHIRNLSVHLRRVSKIILVCQKMVFIPVDFGIERVDQVIALGLSHLNPEPRFARFFVARIFVVEPIINNPGR